MASRDSTFFMAAGLHGPGYPGINSGMAVIPVMDTADRHLALLGDICITVFQELMRLFMILNSSGTMER